LGSEVHAKAGSTQAPEHRVCPIGHAQLPLVQDWPFEHVLPQSPQLAGSVLMSTHSPEQTLSGAAQPVDVLLTEVLLTEVLLTEVLLTDALLWEAASVPTVDGPAPPAPAPCPARLSKTTLPPQLAASTPSADAARSSGQDPLESTPPIGPRLSESTRAEETSVRRLSMAPSFGLTS
jgi:hypothetical protein